MAKRILTAVIWLPIAALGFAFAPVWAIALAISALSVVAVYELLWAAVCYQRSVRSVGAVVDVLQFGILSSAFGRILAGFTVFSGWNAAPGESQI